MRFLLYVASIVLFVLAALAGFGVISGWTLDTIVGVVAAGLACLAAAGVPWPPPVNPPR